MRRLSLALLLAGCHGPTTDDSAPGVGDSACTPQTWFADVDRDGFGDASGPVSACAAPEGTVADATDCDDADAAVAPGAVETCDGLDDDCDGLVDDADPDVEGLTDGYEDHDGDGFGSTAASRCDATGLADVAGDCDDAAAAVHPGAAEACDGVDADCAGDADVQMVTVVGGGTYATVGEAVGAAAAGALIDVCPGEYAAAVTIDRDLRVEGFPAVDGQGGPGDVVIAGDGAPIFTVDAGSFEVGSLTLTGGGNATTPGGAISAREASSLKVTSAILTGNVASSGGAVYGPSNGQLYVVASEISGNTARLGGGVYATGGAIEDSSVDDNVAEAAGGVYDTRGTDPGLLSLAGTILSGNVASGTGGGLATGGEVDVSGGIVRDNTALYGGGVATSDQVGTLSDVEIADNVATGAYALGGGLYVDSDADLTLSGCTVTGNTAETWGGGLYAADATIRVEEGEFTSNGATTGGGVALDGTPDFTAAFVDFGEDPHDNSPSDLYAAIVDRSYTGLGAGTSLVCTAAGCE